MFSLASSSNVLVEELQESTTSNVLRESPQSANRRQGPAAAEKDPPKPQSLILLDNATTVLDQRIVNATKMAFHPLAAVPRGMGIGVYMAYPDESYFKVESFDSSVTHWIGRGSRG
jgi:hypothetical protein